MAEFVTSQVAKKVLRYINTKTILSLNRVVLYSAVLVTTLFILSTTSFAATITVTNTDDSGGGSLRQAIIDATAGDTIDFDVAGTITLTTGQIVINKDLTVEGPGAEVLTISGNNSSRIFNINGAGTLVVSISGLTFTNGSAATGGAIFNRETITEIADCVFSDNFAANFGGAIKNNATIENITNSTFSGNSSGIDSGAIDNYNATIKNITNCTFSGNSALGINGNQEGGFSGAIDNYADGTNNATIENITNSTFSGNSSARDAGAIRLRAFGSGSSTIGNITNSTFSGNSALGTGKNSNGKKVGSNGGAICVIADSSGSSTIGDITNSTFSGNSALSIDGDPNNGFGGAIVAVANGTGSTVTINISFSTIVHNEAGNNAGGIYEEAGSINIRNSIVAFNTGDNCSFPNPGGLITDMGNNYSDDDSCGFGVGDNALILLGSLADNGGPTQTLALLGGSPIDGASVDCEPLDSTGMPSGVPLPTDQRGITRPFGPRCDSGAYENQDNPLIFQLYSFYDLRERESYVQVTSPDSPSTVHVQVFDAGNNCIENDFYDTYTADDTHVYNIRDIVTNNGNPSGVELPEGSYGFVVVTVVEGVGLPADIEGSIIGNFRVIDNSGYEYRSNSQGVDSGTQETFTFNFNTEGNVTASDVIGITVENITSGEVTAVGSSVTFDTNVYDNNEVAFSCSDTTFSCTANTFDYGINDAVPNSRDKGVVCESNVITEGIVELDVVSRTNNQLFIGYVGVNNGNGRGSMDSFWSSPN